MGPEDFEEPERLFMIEFLIDTIHIVKTAVNIPENYDMWLRGETIVSFSFLDTPPMKIAESDFANCILPNKDCVKVGKSCLFAIASNTRPPETFNIRVSVDRQMPFSCRPGIMHIGDAAIDISELFNPVLESVVVCPDIVPVCKSLAETFIIRSEIFQPIGEITAIIRVTSFGKMIVTQFGVGSDKKECFTFTASDHTDVYHLEPMKQTQPFGPASEEIPGNVYPVHIPKGSSVPAVVCPPLPIPRPRSSGPAPVSPCPPLPCTIPGRTSRSSTPCPPFPCPPPPRCPPPSPCPPPICPPPSICPPPPCAPPPCPPQYQMQNYSSGESICDDCGGIVSFETKRQRKPCSAYTPSVYSSKTSKCSCRCALGPPTICSLKNSEDSEPPPPPPEEEEDVQEISADINGHCIVIRVPKCKKKKIKEGELTICPATGGARPCSTLSTCLKQKPCC